MHWSKRFLLPVFGLLALGAVRANALTIYQIDDSTEVVAAYVNGVQIGGACLGETCFITIPLAQPSPANAMDVIWFEEPVTGALSDILTLQEFAGQQVAELRFCSDPFCPVPPPHPDTTLDETGNYETVLKLLVPKVADEVWVQVRSDVPEPSTWLLWASGLVLLGGYEARSRRRSSLPRPS